MRKLFLTLSFAVFSLWLCGQNENPYSQFGYESPIMPERQINNLDSVLTIINPDTSLIIGWITVNTKNRIIPYQMLYEAISGTHGLVEGTLLDTSQFFDLHAFQLV